MENFALFDGGEIADLQLLLVQNGASSWGLTEKDSKPPLLPATVVYDIQMDLARYLSAPWCTSKDRISFGQQNGNRVEIIFSSDEEASVAVFCCAKEPSLHFLSFVSDLARFQGCEIYDAKSRTLFDAEARFPPHFTMQ